MDETKGKVFGTIYKRRPNFSSWVCFSGKGLIFLLEGAETCSCLKLGERFKKLGQRGEEGTGWSWAITKQDGFCFARPRMWKVRDSPWCSLKVGVWLGIGNYWLGS